MSIFTLHGSIEGAHGAASEIPVSGLVKIPGAFKNTIPVFDANGCLISSTTPSSSLASLTANSSQAVHVMFIDGNRTDTYTADGTITWPFKTFSAAAAAIDGDTAIVVAPGAYTEASGLTFSNHKITVYGNQASLSVTGGITINSPHYVRYDLFVTTTTGVVYNNFTAGARCVIRGGSVTGNMTVNSYVDVQLCQMNDGVVTVGETGQLYIQDCTPTSKFTSAGVLIMRAVNMNTGSNDYLVTSTAGQLTIQGGFYINTTAAAKAISCNNGATTVPNILDGLMCGATGGIDVGTAVTLLGSYVGVPSGAGLTAIQRYA